MLLGHWLETAALGQAPSALDALAALLPDEAERARPDGQVEPVTLDALAEVTWSWSAPAAVFPPTAWSSTARPTSTSP